MCGEISKLLWKGYVKIYKVVMKSTKYFFYALVAFLNPSMLYKFRFKYEKYPWNDTECLISISFMTLCTVMAFWSHWVASPPVDPGWLSWEDFRSPQ